MYIDFKITAWERVTIPDELKTEVLRKLKSGEITSSNTLYNAVDCEDLFYQIQDDSGSQLSVEENEGDETICAYDEMEEIFSNGKKIEL
jgi:penicillin V acylase-like amidase (Ntn superfamily)